MLRASRSWLVERDPRFRERRTRGTGRRRQLAQPAFGITSKTQPVASQRAIVPPHELARTYSHVNPSCGQGAPSVGDAGHAAGNCLHSNRSTFRAPLQPLHGCMHPQTPSGYVQLGAPAQLGRACVASAKVDGHAAGCGVVGASGATRGDDQPEPPHCQSTAWVRQGICVRRFATTAPSSVAITTPSPSACSPITVPHGSIASVWP